MLQTKIVTNSYYHYSMQVFLSGKCTEILNVIYVFPLITLKAEKERKKVTENIVRY